MEQPTRPTDLASAAGISISYASEILKDVRAPSRPLAIHIFRKTGWRHEIIAALSDDEIDLLEKVDPWTAPADRQAAA